MKMKMAKVEMNSLSMSVLFTVLTDGICLPSPAPIQNGLATHQRNILVQRRVADVLFLVELVEVVPNAEKGTKWCRRLYSFFTFCSLLVSTLMLVRFFLGALFAGFWNKGESRPAVRVVTPWFSPAACPPPRPATSNILEVAVPALLHQWVSLRRLRLAVFHCGSGHRAASPAPTSCQPACVRREFNKCGTLLF